MPLPRLAVFWGAVSWRGILSTLESGRRCFFRAHATRTLVSHRRNLQTPKFSVVTRVTADAREVDLAPPFCSRSSADNAPFVQPARPPAPGTHLRGGGRPRRGQ